MSRKKKGEPVHGWLILDKPEGVTSTQAVGICRRIFNAQKAGHGGTLDPLASGILPLAFGEATKTVGYVMEADKDYVFTIRWGSSTTTQDREGAVTGESEHLLKPREVRLFAALENLRVVIGERMKVAGIRPGSSITTADEARHDGLITRRWGTLDIALPAGFAALAAVTSGNAQRFLGIN